VPEEGRPADGDQDPEGLPGGLGRGHDQVGRVVRHGKGSGGARHGHGHQSRRPGRGGVAAEAVGVGLIRGQDEDQPAPGAGEVRREADLAGAGMDGQSSRHPGLPEDLRGLRVVSGVREEGPQEEDQDARHLLVLL